MQIDARKFLGLAAIGLVVAACSNDDDNGTGPVPVQPGAAELTGTIAQNRTLSADTTYTVKGFVKVAQGATLTIEPGTTILGDTTEASALFILRGAQIDARGTADRPIVFTSARRPGNRKPGDWGGLVLVGNGRINRSGAVILEGTSTRPADVVNYGEGTAAGDAGSSGTLQYVRIEFAGFAEAQNAELNALTLAAVGSGTTIDHVQALAGLDDSFEWFGGAVDAKYLVSYEAGDDHFDAAEGYRGRNQYLIAMQTRRLQPAPGSQGSLASDPQGFEIDGCDTGATGCNNGQAAAPYNMPVFANFTMIGTGAGVDVGSGGTGMVIRRGTGGTWINGIVARWPLAGLAVRDTSTINRLNADSLVIRNVAFVENGAVFDQASSSVARGPQFASRNAAFDSTSATSASALFVSLPTAGTQPTTATLDWSLAGSAPASLTNGALARPYTGVVAARAGTFIEPTDYVGAAGPSTPKWWAGWTSYSID